MCSVTLFTRLDLRRLPGAACGVALLLCALPARGQSSRRPDEHACAVALKNAEEREQAGHLREAKDDFLTCAQSTCSSLLRQECTTRFLQLHADIPSIIPVVTDHTGAPRVDVQVRMDGALMVARLDGRALPIDPGVHEFSFSADGQVFATQKILVVQGERNRALSVSLAPDFGKARKEAAAGDARDAAVAAVVGRQAPSGPRLRVPRLTYVLGGAGLASLGAGALLTYWGRRDNDALAGCSPDCPPGSVNHIRNLYVASDVAFGLGLAALAAGTWVYWRSQSPDAGAVERNTPGLDVRATRSGAVALVSGRF
jgi:hypothetical protein